MFDDVECKIVETRESPYGHAEEECVLKGRGVEEQEGRGCDADEEEKDAFYFDRDGVFEVCHKPGW